MAKVHEVRLESAEGWLRRLDLGAYRYAEAARLAQTNHQTLTAWLKLTQTDTPEARSGTPDRVKVLSYPQLLELAVVARFRRSAVRLADLAQLHRTLAHRETLLDPLAPASRHPFALRSFECDGLHLCAQSGSTLRRAVQYSQDDVAWNPLIAEFFEQIEYNDRLIVRWYPRGREQGVVADPRLSFGTPVVVGTGIPTYILLDRYRAGESLAEIAEDYGLQIDQVNAALSFEHDLLARVA